MTTGEGDGGAGERGGDDDAPEVAGPGSSQLRARDVAAARSVHDLEDGNLDADTIAKLAAWFDLPAATEDEGEEAPTADRARKVAAALAAVEPRLLERLERSLSADQRLLYLRRLDLIIERKVAAFTHEPAELSPEPREYDIPDELQADLNERAPQAVLRDLMRPVSEFTIQYEIPGDPEVAWVDSGQTIRDVMAEVRHIKWWNVRSEVEDSLAELRALLAQPWEPIQAPDVEAPTSSEPTLEDIFRMMAAGASSADDE